MKIEEAFLAAVEALERLAGKIGLIVGTANALESSRWVSVAVDRFAENQVGCVMNAVKAEAIRLIQSLPDDCSLEDIQYRLYVIQKVERGLAAIDEERVVSQEEAERSSSTSWNQPKS